MPTGENSAYDIIIISPISDEWLKWLIYALLLKENTNSANYCIIQGKRGKEQDRIQSNCSDEYKNKHKGHG